MNGTSTWPMMADSVAVDGTTSAADPTSLVRTKLRHKPRILIAQFTWSSHAPFLHPNSQSRHLHTIVIRRLSSCMPAFFGGQGKERQAQRIGGEKEVSPSHQFGPAVRSCVALQARGIGVGYPVSRGMGVFCPPHIFLCNCMMGYTWWMHGQHAEKLGFGFGAGVVKSWSCAALWNMEGALFLMLM